jgi:predicted phosphodiesterase
VITGHTHRTHKYQKGETLYLNPGSAGPKRFDYPVTVARLHLEEAPWRFEIIQLQVDHKLE